MGLLVHFHPLPSSSTEFDPIPALINASDSQEDVLGLVRGELGLAAGQCVLLYKATPEPPHPAMTWQSLLAISKCFSADPAAPLDLPCIDGLPAVYVKVPAVRTAAAGADFVTPQPTLTAPGLGHAAVADAGRTAAAISTGSSSGVSAGSAAGAAAGAAGSAAGAAAGGGSAGSAGKARVHKAWAPLSFYIARIGFLVRQTNGMYIMRANADNMTLRLGAAEGLCTVCIVMFGKQLGVRMEFVPAISMHVRHRSGACNGWAVVCAATAAAKHINLTCLCTMLPLRR